MSEYEELTKALTTAFDRQRAYEDEGRTFAIGLVNAALRCLGVPHDKISFWPMGGGEEGKRYPIAGALEFHDGYFRMRAVLELPNGYLGMRMQLRKAGAAAWEASLDGGDTVHSIDKNRQGDFDAAVLAWSRRVKDILLNSPPEDFLGGPKRADAIGFRPRR